MMEMISVFWNDTIYISSVLSGDWHFVNTEFASTFEHKNRETVRNLVLQGVAICDFNVEKGESAIKHLENEFGKDRAIFLKTDVSKEDEFEGITPNNFSHKISHLTLTMPGTIISIIKSSFIQYCLLNHLPLVIINCCRVESKLYSTNGGRWTRGCS
jgi:hypothetical protein